MRNKKPKPTLLVTNIAPYLNWWNMVNRFTFIIAPSGNYYVVEGKRIKAEQFELSMPMPQLISNTYPKGKSLDGRSNYY